MRKYIILLLLVAACSTAPQEDIHAVAILPITGNAGIWGESIQQGMEIAKQELEEQGMNIKVTYFDSQANPTEGLSAYKQAILQDPDVVISAFSGVSVPLIELADQDKIPLIMTAVAADNVAQRSPYAFRYFSSAEQNAYTHFPKLKDKENIAVIYRQDEYGVSVYNRIIEKAQEEKITIVAQEAFPPGNTDYKSILVKVEEQNPDAILFVGAVPIEGMNILQQMTQLGINIEFFDCALVLFSVPEIEETDFSVHSLGVDFGLEKSGNELRIAYKQQFRKEPFFAVSLGYDIMILLSQADTESITTSLQEITEFSGMTGRILIDGQGEFNPETVSVQLQ